MKIEKDLKEFIELLNSHRVKYVILGAFALAYHGRPRFTGDIDFLIEASEDNAERLEKVLLAFGFGQIGLKAKDFMEPQSVVQLGRPPHRIDILTSAHGIQFEEVWKTKVETTMDGVPVFMISKDFLIKNKQAVGRPQDLADIDQLKPKKNS